MRALQLTIWPEDRRDHRWEMTNQAIAVLAFVLDEVGTAGVAEQRGRSRRNAPACQAGVNNSRSDGLRQCAPDRFGASLVGFLRRAGRYWETVALGALHGV